MRYESQQETNSGVTSYRITDKDYDRRIATSVAERYEIGLEDAVNERSSI